MLLVTNFIALVFAFFNPPVSVSVMFLYWAECVMIGVLNCVKLWYVTPLPGDGSINARRSIGIGVFMLAYGVFLLTLFSMLYGLGEHEMRGKGVRYDLAGHIAGFWLPVLLIGAGHVISFFRNFLGKREYAGRSAEDQMGRPFKRIALMLLVMFAGMSVIIVTGLPDIGLVLFIPFMIIAGLEAHFRDHAALTAKKGEGT